jgi:hypothetical protein
MGPCGWRACFFKNQQYLYNIGLSKRLWTPDDYSIKNTQKYFKQFQYIRNVDRAVLKAVFENTFGVSINIWRLAGDIWNVTCNFLYCNHQVHRDFLITLYYKNTSPRIPRVKLIIFRYKSDSKNVNHIDLASQQTPI